MYIRKLDKYSVSYLTLLKSCWIYQKVLAECSLLIEWSDISEGLSRCAQKLAVCSCWWLFVILLHPMCLKLCQNCMKKLVAAWRNIGEVQWGDIHSSSETNEHHTVDYNWRFEHCSLFSIVWNAQNLINTTAINVIYMAIHIRLVRRFMMMTVHGAQLNADVCNSRAKPLISNVPTLNVRKSLHPANIVYHNMIIWMIAVP